MEQGPSVQSEQAAAIKSGRRTTVWAEYADKIFDLSNVALVISLIIGVVATMAIVWSAKIREEKSNRAIATANERSASADKSAAEASERAAGLEKEAAAAKLQIAKLEVELTAERNEQLKLLTAAQARDLTDDQFKTLIKALRENPPGDIGVYYYSDPETSLYATSIIAALYKGGVHVHGGGPILPTAGQFEMGTLVVYEYQVPAEGRSPGAVLKEALDKAGIGAVRFSTQQNQYPGLYVPALFISPKAAISTENMPAWWRHADDDKK